MKNSDGHYEELANFHANATEKAINDRAATNPRDAIEAGLHVQLAIAYANLAVAAEFDWANSHKGDS